eukprot:5159991-Amphidinium_carterae.2
MSLPETDNGFIGFQELARRAESGTGLRATSLWSSVLCFDFSGKNVCDSFVQFESFVTRYESQQGAGQGVADSVRNCACGKWSHSFAALCVGLPRRTTHLLRSECCSSPAPTRQGQGGFHGHRWCVCRPKAKARAKEKEKIYRK